MIETGWGDKRRGVSLVRMIASLLVLGAFFHVTREYLGREFFLFILATVFCNLQVFVHDAVTVRQRAILLFCQSLFIYDYQYHHIT